MAIFVEGIPKGSTMGRAGQAAFWGLANHARASWRQDVGKDEGSSIVKACLFAGTPPVDQHSQTNFLFKGACDGNTDNADTDDHEIVIRQFDLVHWAGNKTVVLCQVSASR